MDLPTPIMFLGLTEDTWKWVAGMVITSASWVFWKLHSLATKADIAALSELLADLTVPVTNLATTNEQLLQLIAKLSDESGVSFTAREMMGGGGD